MLEKRLPGRGQSNAAGVSKSDLAREALRRFLAVSEFPAAPLTWTEFDLALADFDAPLGAQPELQLPP